MATKKTAKASSSKKVEVAKSAKKVTKKAATLKMAKSVAKSEAAKPAKKVEKATPKKTEASRMAPAKKGKVLDVGDLAPSFELLDQSGAKISSKSLLGAPYVLYFYPKDNTPGCTQEACDFRDQHALFAKKKAKVFGVSADSEKSHAGFATKYSLPFSLLVDADHALAAAYGAYGPKKLYGREFIGIIRSTFVVGKDGIIAAAFRGVKVPGHVEKVLEKIA